MKYHSVILEDVYEEINEAALYYEQQQEGLGMSLLEEWESAVARIHANPEGYEKKYKNFRQILLERFPYVIMFELDKNNIVIYRFIHVRRHPKKRYPARKK